MSNNPHDDQAIEDVFNARNALLNWFKKDIIEKARKYSGLHNVSLYEACIEMGGYDVRQKRNVSEFESSINKLRLQADKGISVAKLIGSYA